MKVSNESITLRNRPNMNGLTLPQQLNLLLAISALEAPKTPSDVLQQLTHERMLVIQAINCVTPQGRFDRFVQKWMPSVYHECRGPIVRLVQTALDEQYHKLRSPRLKEFLEDAIAGELHQDEYKLESLFTRVSPEDLTRCIDVDLNKRNPGLQYNYV